jgi:molybdate-binding protein/DNA-binding transcriptional regulator YhcF (GntR family)
MLRLNKSKSMDETYLYQQIAEAIRQDILKGQLKPGDHLPSVRAMTTHWGCTPGTVQRAYQELVRQGLLTSRPGQGTRVAGDLPLQSTAPLRRANLIHRAESFLLEAFGSGYSLAEVENAMRMALDRWHAIKEPPAEKSAKIIRFSGSHDLAVDYLAERFPEIDPAYSMQLAFNGSLSGLISLAEGKADLAGSHLWDEESNTYNSAFVGKLFPGKKVALVTLAHRRLGLIIPAGNPLHIAGLVDLVRPEVQFSNRQTGSGTRVWLDANLRRAGITPGKINGYSNECLTHTEVARTIAEGNANVGLGLEAASQAFGLDFIFLTRERYDLVIPEPVMDLPPIKSLLDWLNRPDSRSAIAALGGYETDHSGELTWIE